MAITIDWANTKVISVPRADMTLIQSSPTEIRELNTNSFRLELLDLADNPDGRPWEKTHQHDTETLLGGITYARKLQILDPYTVTFEDGQYAVNLTGSNNNILDKTNKNQVSVNPSNSAGLISSPDIEYSSFQDAIHIDVNSGNTGTTFPAGTPRKKVATLVDALIINDVRLFDKLMIYSDMTINGGSDLNNFTIEGASHVNVKVTLDASAQLNNVKLLDAEIEGILDGGTEIRYCIINNLTFFNGHIHNCGLKGTITLGGNLLAFVEGCKTLDPTSLPEINFGASGQNLSMPGFDGIIYLSNSASLTNFAGVGLRAGSVILRSTFTHGTIHVSGTGRLEDESGNLLTSGTWNGNVTIINTLENAEHTAQHVWDSILIGSTYNIQNSAGKRLRDIASQAIHTDTAQGPAVNGNQIQLALSASSVDGSYDPSMITIIDGTGAGQTRLIYQYEGATRIATVDRNWKVNPDATSEYIVFSHPGREHVNEGLAQAGSINTITLNALASGVDDAYIHQTVFIRSGEGEDQVSYVTAYNGTTKVATIEPAWNIAPDNTTGYVILPILRATLNEEGLVAIADYVWAKTLP